MQPVPLPFIREVFEGISMDFETLINPIIRNTPTAYSVHQCLIDREFGVLHLVTRSVATCAIHCLNGSALGDGIGTESNGEAAEYLRHIG